MTERLEADNLDSTLPDSEKSVLSESPVLREKSVLQRDSSPSQEPFGVGTVLLGRLRDAFLRAAADAFGSVANCFCCDTGDGWVVEDVEFAVVANWLKLRSEWMDEILKLWRFHGDTERMCAADANASSS